MLTDYDPDRAPDPERWLAEKELDLIGLVERYHRRERILLPDPRVHAAVHVMIENQVALGARTPVAEALERLMAEGLSRHDAVHAVGAVLHKHMHRALATQQPVRREAYYDDVRALTKEGWLAEFGPGPDD